VKKAIYLIRTPFQLFNAIESAKRFNDGGDNILICFIKTDKDKKLLNNIISQYSWAEINFFKLKAINKIFYSIRLKNILKKYIKIDYCFFGLITTYIVNAINIVNSSKNVLIDDGNETFLIAKNIKNKFYNEKYKRKKLNLTFLDNLMIFTFFDLKDFNLDNKIIKNNYNEFKKDINNLLIGDEVFFIGSNLIGTYITKEYFEQTMKGVINHYKYKGIKITYIPHRYEDLEYLKELSRNIGFTVKSFSTILELAILSYGTKPKALASIRSTALETLGYLYSIEELEIIKLDQNELLKKYQIDEFSNLYINYMKKNIKLVSVKEEL
jgi:hypothetical protein